VSFKRNQAEAQKVADLIIDHIRKQPASPIILSGHSGGTGIAVWALEKLPADIKIDKLILLASALSPDYDLRLALSHVKSQCYSFCSENDLIVLGAGTKMLGTIDGKKVEAAGRCGFCLPAGADLAQYDKLIQKPYDKSWLQYHNVGDHMGCMMRPFAQSILAPLILPLPRPAVAVGVKDDKVTR
jgi:pimeloyl-ACP methyl ester carboxylesterase